VKLSKKNISYTAILLLSIALGFLLFANRNLKEQNIMLYQDLLKTESEYSSTTEKLSKVIQSLEVDLEETRGENEAKDQTIADTISVLQGVRSNLEITSEERDQLQEDLEAEAAKMGLLSEQVSSITNVVSQIDKLSKTDEELLQKYSKVYFLNEHYIPENLVLIEEEFKYSPDARYWFHRDAYGHLKRMLIDAKSEGVEIFVISAYRSFYAQSDLKSLYTVTYGKGANTFSADQGYSEHQLGTTVDFTDRETGPSFNGFEETAAYQWLVNNAHNYGFTLSYPPDNEYYIFEPWHWRFVGVALATKLHSEGKYFYDLEQRELSQYLISIFDPIP
jgi:D-alanyl-D-alanine carboxypeptidase